MKVSRRAYTLSIERHHDGYLAYFPTLPGCHTWGRTYEEAVANAEEAPDLFLETLATHGDPIPKERLSSAQSRGRDTFSHLNYGQ
jgi:predicted RNase H-like HicB family nuclease